MKFSERYGYKPVRDAIQIESMDEPLKNGIWTILDQFYWNTVQVSSMDIYRGAQYHIDGGANRAIGDLCQALWVVYFKKPIDELDRDWLRIRQHLREYFFSCEWNEVYDFIEFIAGRYTKRDVNRDFMDVCNILLEKEMAGYRFVDGLITPITSPEEVEAIERAIKSGDDAVAQHLRRALELVSDRSIPDYRNSIKESISAIESLGTKVTGSERRTLGQVLKKLDEHVSLHPAFKSALEKLYGYTSDEDGIRHGMMERDRVDLDDAKFMLVICSAFVSQRPPAEPEA